MYMGICINNTSIFKGKPLFRNTKCILIWIHKHNAHVRFCFDADVPHACAILLLGRPARLGPLTGLPNYAKVAKWQWQVVSALSTLAFVFRVCKFVFEYFV